MVRTSTVSDSCLSVSSVVFVSTIGPESWMTLPSSSTTCRLTLVSICLVVVNSVFFLVTISSEMNRELFNVTRFEWMCGTLEWFEISPKVCKSSRDTRNCFHSKANEWKLCTIVTLCWWITWTIEGHPNFEVFPEEPANWATPASFWRSSSITFELLSVTPRMLKKAAT